MGHYHALAAATRIAVVSLAAAIVAHLTQLYRRRGVRGVGRLLRAAAHWLPSLQRLQARTIDGRVLFLDLRDETCLTYCLLGHIPTDRWETEIARSAVAPGDTALDIGAFVGWYSTLLAELVGSSGRVYAFEPNPRSCALLQRAAAPYPQLQVLNAAVGGRTTTSPLYVPDHLHSTSLRPTSDMDAVSSCDVHGIDDFLARHNQRPPSFVKCDAEGAELEILEGARGLLGNDPAVWMVEICAETAARFGVGARSVVDTFAALRYRGYRIRYPSGALEPIENDQLEGIFNAVFVPPALDERMRRWLRR